ncbi:heme-binding domain-containing protein [Horticoccus luteus]|uniref:Heme-binding domain-containing protein n=1 Tax=Horticoccus luteus TaxID=2862869 RepID=A0A8F9U027_9BACT|nr:heme-binding domain-containing protein [Horticoccus luteus]QYM80672.1 heme-binding domain-containing protein [Horticoccus luteus]
MIVFIALQFFRPARTQSPAEPGPDDFALRYAVPEPFRRQLQESCYDCHSNHPRYPWYANVQPIGWWLQSHVNDGNDHLNLSEFGRYSPDKRADKIDSMIDELTFRTMPLKTYSWLHPAARLTKSESDALVDWLQHLRDSMDTD